MTNRWAHRVVILAALFLLAGYLEGDRIAPPAIEPRSLVNAASHMPGTAMAGSLAPGSRFEVRGIRFSNDTQVRIRQGQLSWIAQIVSSDPEKIVAIVPDNIQPGEASIELWRDETSSRPYDIRVVKTSFGIYAATGKGWGPAAQNDSSLPMPPFHSGDAAALWGTGVGSADSARVMVGGVSANHVTISKSTSGIDRLDFAIPANAPFGCSVPVQAIVGGIPSNVVTLSFAPPGKSCMADETWFAGSHAGANSAWIVLMRSKVRLELVPGKHVDFSIDSALASFHREPERDLAGLTPFQLIPPVGTCTSYVAHLDLNSLLLPALVRQTVAGRDLDLGPKVAAEAHTAQSLDAGPFFVLTGPGGTQQVERSIHAPHVYSALLGGNPPFTRIGPKPLFLSPGDYAARIAGGADLPAFETHIRVGQPIQWTNEKNTAELRRDRGLTVRWRAAGKDTLVPVAAINIDRTTSTAGVAVCLAKSSDHEIALPAEMLMNLPATGDLNSDFALGFVAVGEAPAQAPEPIRVNSVDSGYALFVSMTGRTVLFR